MRQQRTEVAIPRARIPVALLSRVSFNVRSRA
jgi:hypothetical protein